jgi:hypothetical protein
MYRIIIAVLALVALAACKADQVEIRLSASDLSAAVSGKLAEVPYEAVYSSLGGLNAEKQEQLDQLRQIAESHMDVSAFDVMSLSSTTTVTITGKLPLIAASAMADADFVYGLVVEDVEDPELSAFGHRLSVVTGNRFYPMLDEMQAIDLEAGPDAVNPVVFRISADGKSDFKILAGGYSVEGESVGIGVMAIPAGESYALSFSGGAYDEVGASLLFSKP